MTKKLFALLILSGALLGVSACANTERAANLPPGTYESTRSSTDAYGTETERERTTNVTVDKYGNRNVEVESKTTRDPKGLFNKKTTSETKETVKQY